MPVPRSSLLFCVLIALSLTLLLSCHDNGNTVTTGPGDLIMTPGAPVTDTIAAGGFNTYAVDSTAGVVYKISVSGAPDDLDLLYFGNDYSLSMPGFCTIDNTALMESANEDCIVVAPGGRLYFAVDGYFLSVSSTSYTIAVEEISTATLNLSQPASDTLSRTSANLYSFPVTAGNEYTVALTGLNDDADLYVFDNDTLAMVTCSIDNRQFTGSTPEDCTVSAATTTLFFLVDGIFSATDETRFTAYASPAPAAAVPINQGTPASPIVLSLHTPVPGQVASFPSGSSFYAATGLTPGLPYTIGINGLTSDADLTVYTDSTFTTPASCSIDNTLYLRTTPEACTLFSAGDALYFRVTSVTSTGGVAFLSLIEPGP
jgi:hypothetical protein